MKQYKLIKKYPSLPLDWEVGMIVGQGDRGTYADFSPCDGKYRNFYIICPDVVNYPEFWEEVKEPEYKIVKWIDEKGNGYEDGEPIFTIAGDGKMHILAVERVSDLEYFAVGQRAQTIGKYPHIIEAIEIRQKQKPNREYNGIDRIWLKWKGNAGGNWLESLERVDGLFTTQDGVELFGGETIYHVCSLDNSFNLNETVARVEISNPPIYFHYFAEKENAEKFISDNKKMYTLKDMVRIANHWAYIKSVTPEVAQKVIDKWTN